MSSRRRPKFTNRFTEARRAVLQRLARLRDWFRPTTLFAICFTLLTLVTTLLLAQIHTQLRARVYSEGDVVRASVVSPADIVAIDERETEAARAVLPNAPPTLITLKRNQVVARSGDTVTPKMLAQFDAISKYGDTGRRTQHFIGIFLLVGALYLGAWKFIEYRSLTASLALSKGRAFTLLASAILIQTILIRVGVILAETIAAQSVVAPWNDASLWSLAIPFAVATLLVAALLMDGQLALTAGIITALFAGLVSPNGMLIACYAMVSSSAAIYGIGRYSERQSVTLAGLFVAAVNAAAALAVILAAQEPLTLGTILMAVGCGLLGGLFTTIFTSGALPVSESVFGILTDVKLLELSNADLPVLGQLALRAPGTNQHSHAVGQLTEEACRSIGANALLARIGALYHDIGKLAAPDMFVENQTGVNPHDRLRPSSSAKIITSHVTYGLKLAKEIGLPAKIAAFIPQHHGTRTLHYFLRKAQAQAIHGDQVNEADFRYPGPRPQFKEAAIMMLADSCEAAARSLARPDPENIRSIVSKIYDAIVSDGQLDECDLSLRELTKTKESMIASLVAIYHSRVDYPGFNPPAVTGALSQLPPADIDTEERGIGYKTSEVPISKGGEVEDEAITRK